MSGLIDERLVSLNEIATDCFNVEPFALDAKRPDIRVAVSRPILSVRLKVLTTLDSSPVIN
jgi:hypothetical protein